MNGPIGEERDTNG